jgi:hypothetical protein
MANEKHPEPLVHPGMDGIHVGDMVMRPGPTFGTDGHLDTPASRERDRAHEEDAHAAQQAGVTGPALQNPLAGPAAAQDRSLSEATAGEGLDDAIAEARDGAAPAAAVPILLRDPVTGEPVGQL